jgi:RND family efflux transporter MFP subunit
MSRLAKSRSMRAALLLAAAMPLLSACGDGQDDEAARGRPVGVVVVEPATLTEEVRVTGDIQARKDVEAAFRIGGRVIERKAEIGARLAAGDLIARLDPATEENALKAARATLTAARGEVSTARNSYERQERLLAQGFTTRPRYDQARQDYETALARLEDAEARADATRDRLGFTELKADAAGTVTAIGAEPGEVVQPGQMVVRIARDDGRDAVVEVPAALLQSGSSAKAVRVSLVSDPSVTAAGRVREVSPEADPVTRTFRVRIGLEDPPEAMRLGAPVTAAVDLASNVVVAIPASALTAAGPAPAVWVVDPATSAVALRPVEILRFETGRAIVAEGLEPGDIVVTAGTQALHPGQKVRTPDQTKPDENGDRKAKSASSENTVTEVRG